ncbi:MAG TPA: histidine kinase [Vicinamibacterales bacterium]
MTATPERGTGGRGESRLFGYPAALVHACAWTIVGTVGWARYALQDPDRVLGPGVVAGYLLALTCYVPWIALTPIVFRLERRLPVDRGTWPRHAAALAAIGLPFACAASLATYVNVALVHVAVGAPLHVPDPVWIPPARDLMGHGLLYVGSVAAAWLVRALVEARESERRAARLMLEKSQLETSLRQTELDVLRMRLNPHFLFNSLQNISVLTLHDPETASRMLTKLGDLLRVSLRRDTGTETTLEAEAALASAYLTIEQMRFGDRLSFAVDLEPGTERALVPSFLLQPLVENAIRHGLDGVRHHGVIAIRARLDGDSLLLTVTDNGAGPNGASPARGNGIGVGATCERLARLYPGRHAFAMRAVPDGGTEVAITLPLRFDPAEAPLHAHAAAAHR